MSEFAKIVAVLEKANGKKLNLDSIFEAGGFATKEEVAMELSRRSREGTYLAREEGPGGRMVYSLRPNVRLPDFSDEEAARDLEALARPPQRTTPAEPKMKTVAAVPPSADRKQPNAAIDNVRPVEEKAAETQIGAAQGAKVLGTPPLSQAVDYTCVLADLHYKRSLLDRAIESITALAAA